MRLALRIAYNGSNFQGWQRQPTGNTVENTIEAVLNDIHDNSDTRIVGSGRTDAGVHALEQVAHFDPPAHSILQPQEYLTALNGNLPPEIRVTNCQEVDDTFHARYSARSKTYRYRIYCGDPLPPLEHQRAWHLRKRPDWALLQETLQLCEGKHDFAHFAANRGEPFKEREESTRTISSIACQKKSCSLNPKAQTWTIDFCGNGFLYKMVRLLTGTATKVAQNKIELEQFKNMLEQPETQQTVTGSTC